MVRRTTLQTPQYETNVRGEGNLSLAVERGENKCVSMMIGTRKWSENVFQVSNRSVETVRRSSKKGDSDRCNIREMRARTTTTRGAMRPEVNTL